MRYEDSYKQFLKELHENKNREIYARITVLSFSELPLETIEGRVTGGSINIDGSSAIRRSCSLTITAQNFKYNHYYWGLDSKFKLEIGIKNKVDPEMPDIIWFNKGIFILTTFNTSENTNSCTISINGKDKMCLLNGEIGGSLEATIDFGVIEEEDVNGVWHINKVPIADIIRNMVHTYAGEPLHNIIINDLDTYGLELLEYRYDTPMYLYRNYDGENLIYHNMIMENDNLTLYIKNGNNYTAIKLKDIDIDHLDILVEPPGGTDHNPQPVYFKDGNTYSPYIFAKIEYGQTAGYRISDLIYAGDLVANAGESITSVLDKIKNMLVEFEYFYNTEGQFIFQKKKSFISTMWTPTGEESDIVEYIATSTANAYIFDNDESFTALSNNPNLANLKNDYSVWGERSSTAGAKIPIHLRYAIDHKPQSYTTISVADDDPQVVAYNAKYNTNLKGQTSIVYSSGDYDWREIIYQMALDYYKYNILDDFEIRIMEANPVSCPTGQTGYEKYYIDLQGFWRQLYNPFIQEELNNCDTSTLDAEINRLQNIIDNPSNAEVLNAAKDEILIYEVERDKKLKKKQELELQLEEFYYENDVEANKRYWHKDVFEHPENLNFWFDFLDTEGQLDQFNVKNIGFRSKVVNETTVKSIYFRETPAVVFTNLINGENKINTYRYLQIPDSYIDEMFSISAQGKSAKDRLDELIYNHGYCIETVSITSLPIYNLDVNTRIYVHGHEGKINGDYIVNKLTLPLTYNGTMNISAIKAAENILY